MSGPDQSRALAYSPIVLEAAPRLLGLLDREPDSVSYGAFDREHWAWKFRDFPVTMLQTGVYPLALLWALPLPASPYHRNPRVLEWVHAALIRTCGLQRRNGAFDSVAPNTQDHGVSLAMCDLIGRTLAALGDSADPAVAERAVTAAAAAAEFASRSEEDYAFIANHQALFALGWLQAQRLTGDDRYGRRARRTIADILGKQSRDGWFPEYGGFDPGYETLTIAHLAELWQHTGDDELLVALQRCVGHLALAVGPDGALGGSGASRNTRLYDPSGLERLSVVDPVASAIAGFMRERLERGNVVTPTNADAHNLMRLIAAYLEACRIEEPAEPGVALPCQALDGVEVRDKVAVAGRPGYYAQVSLSAGGTLRVYDRATGTLAYEDAGYAVYEGDRVWSSQALGSGTGEERDPGVLEVRTRFGLSMRELPTPGRFLTLRVLNLTAFRSRLLGRWIRARIIGRLITARTPGPFHLRRTFSFETDRIRVEDEVSPARHMRVSRIRRPRSFAPFHMGSSKYFHGNELSFIAHGGSEPDPTELSAGRPSRVSFELRLGDEGAELARDTAAIRSPEP